MAARGIIGKKPTTTGVVGYSDVFGPGTQFSERTVGTWPSTGMTASGSAKFVIFNTQDNGIIFDSYKRMSDGLYHPERIYDSLPSTTGNNGFWSGSSLTGPARVASRTFVGMQVYMSNTTTGTELILWKRVANYNAQYKYLGQSLFNETPGGTAYRIISASFSDDETLFVTFWHKGGTNSNQVVRVYTVDVENEIFTEISVPDAVSTTTAITPSSRIEWNRQGTSVFIAFTISPYHVIYNVSGNTFTKLPSLPSFPTSMNTFAADWNYDGSSLAVFYGQSNSAGTLLIYNRSGDTFSLVATISVSNGYPGVSTGKFVSWNPAGNLLAIGLRNGPIQTASGYGISPLIVYSRSGDTFTPISVPNPLGVQATEICTLNSVNFSNDGSELYISVRDTGIDVMGPGVEIYKVNGTTITRNTEWGFVTTNRYYFSAPTRISSQLGTTYGVGTKHMTNHECFLMIR